MPATRPSHPLNWLIVPLALLGLAALLLVRGLALPAPADDAAPVNPGYSAATGVNLSAAELHDPSLADTLATLDRAGVRWLRFTFPWDDIEPVQGQFEWARWDAVMRALAEFPALQPVVVLDRSPAWARTAADADNPLAPPHERADYGAFVRAVAARYGAQLRYYQVWHEPNIAPHWGARPADPADYLGLLREAAANLRAADAGAIVVLGALAPTTEGGGVNLSDLAYLDALYTLDGAAWFDVVAGQPYGFARPPDDPADSAVLNFGRARLLHDVMLRHGDAATPLWAAAFGWYALPAGQSDAASSSWEFVTAAQQAQYAGQALALARREWPWLGPLFWPAYCPAGTEDDTLHGFALCTADGDETSVWQAVTAVPIEPALPPGSHAPDHPVLQYGTGWRVTAGAADPSADGDTLTFTFYGTALSLRVQGGPYWAYYRVEVDGAPANALPLDETGTAYLVLHDPAAAVRLVTVAEGLPLAEHRVRIEARGGWGQWALQGIVVDDNPLGQAPRGRLLVAALTAAAAVALAALVLAWPAWRRLAGWLRRPLDHAARLPDASLWAAAVALALLFVVSRWAVVDLAALAGLGLLFLIRPDLSLPLIAAALPFWQSPKHILRWGLSHAELFLAVAVLALAARWVLAVGASPPGPLSWLRPGEGESERVRSAQDASSWHSDLAMLALVASGLLSTLVAAEQGVAWREFRIVFLFGGLFYLLITRVPLRPGAERLSPWPLVAGLLAGMVAASLIGLVQLVTGEGRIDVEGVWRVRALYGSPNNLALVLDRGVPLALALAAFLPLAGRWRRMIRVALMLVTVTLLLACVATFSKGALLLGLPVGIALVLLLGVRRSGQRWPLWILGGAVLIGLAGLALLFRTPRFADLFNFETGTSFLRVRLWQAAWQMALDHPLLGVGPDNFLYAYRSHYVLPSAWEELNLSHPHNLLLDLWTRLGLVGVLAGLWALAVAFRSAWRSFRRGSIQVWPLALGLLAGLAATVLHGLIDNSLFLPDLIGLFVIALALPTHMMRSRTDEVTSKYARAETRESS